MRHHNVISRDPVCSPFLVSSVDAFAWHVPDVTWIRRCEYSLKYVYNSYTLNSTAEKLLKSTLFVLNPWTHSLAACSLDSFWKEEYNATSVWVLARSPPFPDSESASDGGAVIMKCSALLPAAAISSHIIWYPARSFVALLNTSSAWISSLSQSTRTPICYHVPIMVI